MSQQEFLDWLREIGGGWLGYTEEQLDATTIPYILAAFEGKVKMLQACFGGPVEDDGKTTIKSAEDFDKVFA